MLKLRLLSLVALLAAAPLLAVADESRDPDERSEPRIRRASQVEVGTNFSCALIDAQVRCWGANGQGQLGLGHTRTVGTRPADMGDGLMAASLGTGARVLRISVGGLHTCALLMGGGVKCWGQNNTGQLGLGDVVNRGTIATQMGDALPFVDLGRPALDVVAGGAHSCAILDDRSVKCWGQNSSGQLGLNNTAPRGNAAGQMGAALPIVALGRPALGLSLGTSHSCALLDGGEVKCWGQNGNGQLGQGTNVNHGAAAGSMESLRTIDLGPGVRAISVTAGDTHTCVLTNTYRPKCFGANEDGQLGLGDVVPRGSDNEDMGGALPYLEVEPSLRNSTISCGLDFCCATLELAFAAKCWGANDTGQLGLEDQFPRGGAPDQMGSLLPFLDLGPLARVMSVSAGTSHSCALLDGGVVKCWGTNNAGQLGQGSTTASGAMPGTMGSYLPETRL